MTAGRLRVEGRVIADEQGRQVVLHGTNYSGRHKLPPYYFAERPEDLDQLAALGFDVIRFVTTWEAIEPDRDRFDDDYVARVAKICRWATDRGIHVIVDMHQDVYSRWFGGSGAPGWSIPESIRPAAPWEADRFWFMRYGASEEVRTCLARFWENEDDLQDHWIASLARIASATADNPGVIGFQPYNEPFFGAAEIDDWEVARLLPFYEKAASEVRKAAPHWIAFLEGVLMASESGTALPVDRIENAVYFPHYYDKMALMNRSYERSGEMEKVMKIYEADAARMNAPWMLGEYGIAADASGARECLVDQQRLLSKYSSGGTVWHYNPTGEGWNFEGLSFVKKGLVETPLCDVLCRPYPIATAGRLVEHDFDDDNGVFTMTWDAEEGETVVFLPRRHFDPGAVELSSGSAERDGDRLHVRGAAGRATMTVRR